MAEKFKFNFINSEDFKSYTKFIYTGNASFDLAISDGKGMPIGAFITIFAAYGVGKTTLCCDLAKRLIEKGRATEEPYRVVYIDAEGSMSIIENMGLIPYLDSEELLYQPGYITFKGLEELYNDILEGKNGLDNVQLVIIDSLKAVTTEAMEKKSVEGAHFGINQKAASEFLLKFEPKCVGKLTTIMIAHEADDTSTGNTFTGPGKKESGGGKSAAYMSTVLLQLGKKTSAQDDALSKIKKKTIHGEKEIVGKYIVTIKSPKKNRYARLGGEVEMLVDPGKRIINGHIIKDILTSNKLINKSGNGYVLDDNIASEEKKGVKLNKKEICGYISKNEDWLLYGYIIPNGLFKYNLEEETEDPDGW